MVVLSTIVTTPSDWANALPHNIWPGLLDWPVLDHLKRRRSSRLGFHIHDGKGDKTGEFFYRMEWDCNGQFSGNGHYINNATMVVENVSVNPLLADVTAVMSIGKPFNFGSASNPLAALPVRVEARLDNWFNTGTYTAEITLYGDCTIDHRQRLRTFFPQLSSTDALMT